MSNTIQTVNNRISPNTILKHLIIPIRFNKIKIISNI